MDKKTEALKLALEALERLKRAFFKSAPDGIEEWESEWVVPAMSAITAIREALAEQPAQQEPVEEFAYKAITKRGEHCHFGTHAAARIWAGEGGEVETIKLRHLELVEQPAQQEPQPPYEFERYVAGSLRAQGVRVERATTLADAMRIAAKICPPSNPPSAPTVLVYTSSPNVPPARASKPWVGLTDEEIQTIWRNSEHMTVNQVCRAIEAKLREKNA